MQRPRRLGCLGSAKSLRLDGRSRASHSDTAETACDAWRASRKKGKVGSANQAEGRQGCKQSQDTDSNSRERVKTRLMACIKLERYLEKKEAQVNEVKMALVQVKEGKGKGT